MILADKSLVLRYVIPFSFQTGYHELFQRTGGVAQWELCTMPAKKTSVFPHLYQAFYGDGCDNSMGSTWKFRDANKLPQLSYSEDPEQAPVRWRISQVRLHLFHTNIGLLWYELELANRKDSPELDTMIRVNNQFKNCSYTKEHFKVLHRRRSKEEQDIWNPFDASVWLGELLSPLGELRYMCGTCLKDGKECPDKALVFNYLLLCGDGETPAGSLGHTAFWMANGYTKNYLPSPEALSACVHPFSDVCLYASRSGCGYYAYVNEGNRAFFTTNFNDSIRNEYFFLYLLVLYQSFSLMYFSQKCASEFSSDPRPYKEAIEIGERLDELAAELNTFLMKGMHSSVSSVQHHNDFYSYLKERLMIREDIESLKIGTDALLEIQHMRRAQKEAQMREAAEEEENRRDRRQNIALAMLSLFSVFAVFHDLDELFRKIVRLDFADLWEQICAGSGLILAEVIVYCIVLACAGYCAKVLVTGFMAEYKRNRADRKNESPEKTPGTEGCLVFYFCSLQSFLYCLTASPAGRDFSIPPGTVPRHRSPEKYPYPRPAG